MTLALGAVLNDRLNRRRDRDAEERRREAAERVDEAEFRRLLEHRLSRIEGVLESDGRLTHLEDIAAGTEAAIKAVHPELRRQ